MSKVSSTYGFTVNKGKAESYLEVVEYEDCVTIGDGKNQFAFTLDEWYTFVEKFPTIVRYFYEH